MNRRLVSLALALPLAPALLSGACRPAPPVARVTPVVARAHGEARVDPYRWLREKSNPDVLAYLRAENAYTEATLRPTKRRQEHLYREMVARIKETDRTVPARLDDFYYYQRTVKGKQYPIYCRKKGSLEAPEEVLLDHNALAAGHKYSSIGVFEVSPDHRLLAYSVDNDGSETYTIHVKDLATGKLLPDRISNTYYSLAWANDSKTFFYTVLDPAKRPYRVHRHTLGSAKDPLIHEEKDEAFHLRVRRSRSRQYILLAAGSIASDEVRALRADEPAGEFRVIEPRRPKVEYSVEHHGERFYIATNDGAKNFKLVRAPVADPSRKNWEDVLPYREAVKIDAIAGFRDHLVVFEREGGLKQVRVIPLRSGESYRIDFPEPVYNVWLERNPEFDTDVLRFSYSSLLTPRSVYDYDMRARTRVLMKRDEVRGGYDPARYRSERIWAKARDGVAVPVSLAYRVGRKKDGANPLLLQGYGAYGASSDPTFSPHIVSLLDRGVIVAIAHVRGGGEMGRTWYEDGKFLKKRNTFTDFIACAEHLIAEGYTSSARLAIWGGSAGGLLIGAVLNLRPDLFKAALADVPFVDVLNTMLDPSLPLTVLEYEEWGNPNDKPFYEYIKSYSPYDNVAPREYPNILVTAGLSDPRVSYWEPAKWVARLRAHNRGRSRILLKTKLVAGHFGPSGRYDAIRDLAFRYAFLLHVLGVEEPPRG